MEFFSIITNGAVAAMIYTLTSLIAFKATKQANLDLASSYSCAGWPITNDPETITILGSTLVSCTPPALHLKKSGDMNKPHPAKDLLAWAAACHEHDACR